MFLKETFKKEDDFILMFWVKRSEYFIEGILNLFIKEKKWKPLKKLIINFILEWYIHRNITIENIKKVSLMNTAFIATPTGIIIKLITKKIYHPPVSYNMFIVFR